MPDVTRPSYTRFFISFIPEGKAASAEKYYYVVWVNDVPIYVDGFAPDKYLYPLQKGTTNWISFGLENLYFRGEFNGYEKLRVTVVFLDGTGEVARVELNREYAALRPADSIETKTAFGTFFGKVITWSRTTRDSRF